MYKTSRKIENINPTLSVIRLNENIKQLSKRAKISRVDKKEHMIQLRAAQKTYMLDSK